MFDVIEVSTRRPCVQWRAFMDRGLAPLLLERRLKVRAGLEDKPLWRAYHPVDDGSLEELAGLSNNVPTKPSEPTPIVQRIQEPPRIGAVLH